MLHGTHLPSIGAGEIAALIDQQVAEDRHIELKRELPDRSGKGKGGLDKVKREFAADISAFANSAGGDVVFGVDEVDGVASGIVPVTGIDMDATLRWMTQVINAQLDPTPVPMPDFRVIDINGGNVLVVRVPKSFTGPHMIKQTGRFFARRGAMKLPMDASELRLAFSGAESWGEKAERFRMQRIGRVVAEDLPCGSFPAGARMVTHLIPFSAFSTGLGVDVRHLGKSSSGIEPPINAGWGPRYNLDGVCIVGSSHGTNLSYVQFFRSGIVEVVAPLDMPGHKALYLPRVENMAMQALERYVQPVVDQGASLPVAVLVTVVGASGHQALYSPTPGWDDPKTIEDDLVMLPSTLVGDIKRDPREALRDTFYSLYQACGYERSFSYDDQGNWVRKE